MGRLQPVKPFVPMCASIVSQPRRRLRHRASLAGLTLVEVMVAMSLFAIMALGTLGAMIQSRKMSEGNVAQATAAVIAQGIIEQVQLNGYNTVSANPTIPLKFTAVSSTNLSVIQAFDLPWAADSTTFTDIGAVDTTAPGLPVLGVLLDQNYQVGLNVIRPARYMKMRVNLQRIANTNDDNVEIVLTYSWQPPTSNGQTGAPYLTRELRTIRSQTPSY